MDVDMELLRSWIGRQQSLEDTVAEFPVAALDRTRRTWWASETSPASSQRGRPMSSGGPTMRWRSRGTTAAARRIVASSPSGVGERSSRPTTRIGDRRIGSDSMRHIRLSDADSRVG